MRQRTRQPWLIAHRAGNEPQLLANAVRSAADAVEVDVWFHRGRIEVGHTRTLGPIPLLWDHWELAFGWRRRSTLDEVLLRIPMSVEVYYDLKGGDARLPGAVRSLAEEHRPGQPRMVSSQVWRSLEHFRDDPLTRVLRSVGSASMLRKLPDAQQAWPGGGVAVHAKLVTPQVVAEAQERAPLFFSWPVNDAVRARDLLRAGVNGLISDDYPLLDCLRAGRTPS